MLHFIKLVLAVIVGAASTHYILQGNTGPIVRELATPVTNIDEVVAHPNRYDGKVVKVVGTVVGSAAIMSFGGYRLQQEGGSKAILVISRGGVPTTGTVLNVSGTFKQTVSINDYSYPVILREF